MGEHAIWGKHCLYEQALRSPLMIRYPGLVRPGVPSAAIVQTIDIFPTLVDLCGLPLPERLDGRSLRPQLADPGASSTGVARGFWTGGQRTVRTDRWRLIAQRGNDGSVSRVELFDYQTDPDESRNVADQHPETVRAMLVPCPI